ncbi:MAG: hypothetical protein EP297_13980 [Gammaproteobacteria bacterium]|nr:MAG: hypothetical protein EP297_13980 [Gammaproteobacteria bacterium]
MNSELSLDQAPPISVPFRFFITAPLFGMTAAVLLLAYSRTVFLSRWAPETLALTHLLTLGFIGLVMCGAIIQMLPVLGGRTIPNAKPASMIIHTLLVAGILTFITGLLTPSSILMTVTLVLLGSGFGIFILIILITTLLPIKTSNKTVSTMRLALISLLITITMGISLLSVFIWPGISLDTSMTTDLHLTWGILGWIALLLIGLAYQVVPMFQMTNEYPLWMRRYLLPILFAGLVIWTIAKLSGPSLQWLTSLIMLLCIAGYISFSIVTLWLQQNRSRRSHDVTLLFWRFAMLSALTGAALWLINTLMPGLINSSRYHFILGVILLTGFAVSVINGMLYKIMPFLIWFHLQHRQLALGLGRKYAIPNMKQIIPDQHAQRHFNLHTAGVLALILASTHPTNWLIYLAGLITLTSFALLLHNQFKAIQLYRDYNRRLKAASKAVHHSD